MQSVKLCLARVLLIRNMNVEGEPVLSRPGSVVQLEEPHQVYMNPHILFPVWHGGTQLQSQHSGGGGKGSEV